MALRARFGWGSFRSESMFDVPRLVTDCVHEAEIFLGANACNDEQPVALGFFRAQYDKHPLHVVELLGSFLCVGSKEKVNVATFERVDSFTRHVKTPCFCSLLSP
jgi:hypothetical protein